MKSILLLTFAIVLFSCSNVSLKEKEAEKKDSLKVDSSLAVVIKDTLKVDSLKKDTLKK